MSVGGSRDSRRMPETRPEQLRPDGPGKKWAVAVGALVVVFVGLAGYDLISRGAALNAKPVAASSASRTAASSAAGAPSASGTGGSNASGAVSGGSAPPATPPSGSASATASPSGTGGAGEELTAVSVAAFGPNGTSDGDNPGNVSHGLVSGSANPWHSSWYATAAFGNLQSGTGLLLDMGSPVSVSAVRLELGASAGADVQVRVGNTPDLADLSTAASASDAGGTVTLPLSSQTTGRYVLIWFTLLPPDGKGTYQITVKSITVTGTP